MVTWKERYETSLRNAIVTIKRHQPYEMFLCVVEPKYKRSIWNTAMKKVAQETEPSLFKESEC